LFIAIEEKSNEFVENIGINIIDKHENVSENENCSDTLSVLTDSDKGN